MIFFPILWMMLDELQDRARGVRHSAVVSVLSLDDGELRRRPGAQRLSPSRHQFDRDRRRLDADRAAHRHPRRLVDGVRSDEAHARHPAVDAIDQDDAAGRRAGADLSPLPRPSACSIRRGGLIIVLCLGNLPIVIWMLFTYFKEIPKDILEAARMDGATVGRELIYVLTPMALPGIASTLLLNVILAWNEAFWTLNLSTLGGGAAHRLHRVLFEPGGSLLGQAFGRLDARHRADPRPRLVQPAPARPRADLRRRQVAGEQRSWARSHSRASGNRSDGHRHQGRQSRHRRRIVRRVRRAVRMRQDHAACG